MPQVTRNREDLDAKTGATFFTSIIDQTILHRLLVEEYSRLIGFAQRLERKGFRKLAWAQLDRAEQIGNLIDVSGQEQV